MVLVKRFRSRVTPVQPRSHPHGEADDVLDDEHDQRQQPADGMRRREMCPFHAGHFDLHDGESGDKGHERGKVERCMDILATPFPFRVCRCDGLLEENRLREDEDGRGHGDWMPGEEDDRARGDVRPDVAAKDDDAYFGEDAGHDRKPSSQVRSGDEHSVSRPPKQRFRLGSVVGSIWWLLRNSTSRARHFLF